MQGTEILDRLKDDISHARGKFLDTRLGKALTEGRVPLAVYKGYLAQTYHFVKHTPCFLAVAASRFPFTPDMNVVRRRFLKHCLEEFGHEQLALRDYEALGGTQAELEQEPILTATTAMIAFHYYLAEHEDPIALFGMIYALEGIAQDEGGGVANALRASGIPEKALTFIATHGEVDVAHMKSACATIREFVHGVDAYHKIVTGGKGAFELYAFMFEAIWDQYAPAEELATV